MDKDKQALDRALSTNTNLRLVKTLQTVQPGQPLTEAQKIAFQALMRLATDPRDVTWKLRVKKMNARHEREMARARPPEPVPTVPEEPKRLRLRAQVKDMRKNGQFPLRPQVPSDRARRYGFIPASQRQKDVKDYARV